MFHRSAYIGGTDGEYTWLFDIKTPTTTAVTLLDEKTARKRVVYRQGCGTPWLGGPWLAFDCPTAIAALFSLRTGLWRYVNYEEYAACYPNGECDNLGHPVGRHWLWVASQCDSCTHTDGSSLNLYSGRVDDPRLDSHTMLDLDAITLTKPVCAPLATTAKNDIVYDTDGQFVAAPPPPSYDRTRYDVVGSRAPLGGFALAYSWSGVEARPFLERCGSGKRVRLPDRFTIPWTGNARGLLFLPKGYLPRSSAVRWLNGVLLPSLRRFRIPLPASMVMPSFNDSNGGIENAVMSDRRLYVVDSQNRTWVAVLPPILRAKFTSPG